MRASQATRYFSDVNFPARVEDVQASMVAHHAPRAAVRALNRFPRGHVFRRAAELPDLPISLTLPEHDAPVDTPLGQWERSQEE